MTLYFAFATLQSFWDFARAMGFNDAQGWSANIQIIDEDLIAVEVSSPMVVGFPRDLHVVAEAHGGEFRAWRYDMSMN